jgi:hypothetical protein
MASALHHLPDVAGDPPQYSIVLGNTAERPLCGVNSSILTVKREDCVARIDV